MGCHAFLQLGLGTQGSNPGLQHCRQILYQLSYQGSPFLRMYVCVYIYIHTHIYMCVCIHIYVCTCVCVPSHVSCVQLFATPWTVAHQAPLYMGDSPIKNTRVGCHALLQGIFPTQGLNPCLSSPALAGGFLPLCLGSPYVCASICISVYLPSYLSGYVHPVSLENPN